MKIVVRLAENALVQELKLVVQILFVKILHQFQDNVCFYFNYKLLVNLASRRPPQPEMSCNSPGCFNEDICCPFMGLQGQCQTNATFMACNCKVSCGMCVPRDYNYGSEFQLEKLNFFMIFSL